VSRRIPLERAVDRRVARPVRARAALDATGRASVQAARAFRESPRSNEVRQQPEFTSPLGPTFIASGKALRNQQLRGFLSRSTGTQIA